MSANKQERLETERATMEALDRALASATVRFLESGREAEKAELEWRMVVHQLSVARARYRAITDEP